MNNDARAQFESGTGFDCIVAFDAQKGRMRANTSSPVTVDFGHAARGLRVIGSSEQVHVVDALAITGDEGRGSLR